MLLLKIDVRPLESHTLMMSLYLFWVLKVVVAGCQWRDRTHSDFIKMLFICVPKINESLTGLEQREGE